MFVYADGPHLTLGDAGASSGGGRVWAGLQASFTSKAPDPRA